MTAQITQPVVYDPFSVAFQEAPFPVYRRLRDEAPVYRSEKWGFWALSRYDDVRADAPLGKVDQQVGDLPLARPAKVGVAELAGERLDCRGVLYLHPRPGLALLHFFRCRPATLCRFLSLPLC